MLELSQDLSKGTQLDKALRFYDYLIDEDEKFVLMKVMLQAVIVKLENSQKCVVWKRLEQRLCWDFQVHERTIRNWIDEETVGPGHIGPIGFGMIALLSMHAVRPRRILFVCTINVMRSATAHRIYAHDLRFDVKSAGIHRSAEIVISKELLDWSDTVVVMEERHRNFILRNYPETYKGKNIVCLDVRDSYDYMQKELIISLRVKFENLYESGLI